MKIYFEKTNGNNIVIITDGETAKIFDAAPTGIYEGVDLYADDAAELLKNYFQQMEKDGDLNDFDDIYSPDEIPVEDLQDELDAAELVFENLSEGTEARETYSVEFAPDYNDDTFTGTFDECKKYLEDYSKEVNSDDVKEARIVKILEENGIVVEALEIFEYSDIFKGEEE